MGIEPTASTMATSCSTTELRLQIAQQGPDQFRVLSHGNLLKSGPARPVTCSGEDQGSSVVSRGCHAEGRVESKKARYLADTGPLW